MAGRDTDAVVVVGIDSASAVTCVRSLGRHGIHTIVASEQESVPVFRSRYCDEAVLVPAPADSLTDYADALLELAQRPDTRAIVPLREEDVYVLAKHRSAFEEHVAALWPPLETVRTVHDRVRLVEVAAKAGIRVPETHLLDDVDDWDRKQLVKGRYSVLTDGYVDSLPPGTSRAMGSAQYLEPGIEPDREEVCRRVGHVPIVQEYIPGAEHSLWALYDHGEPVATCQMHQHRAWQYPGGTSICRETVRIPELEEAGRAMLDALDWHGFASVQFMRHEETGEFTLMEVNPRVWASIPCAVRAGADFPYYYWRLAVDGVHLDAGYDVGVATHRLRGELVHLYSVLREEYPYVEKPRFSAVFRDVVSSLFRQPHFDYLTLDDPRPFVQDVRHGVGTMLPAGAVERAANLRDTIRSHGTRTDDIESVPVHRSVERRGK